MADFYLRSLASVDTAIAAGVLPLACWMVLSGLDDLFLDVVWVVRVLTRRCEGQTVYSDLMREAERSIAIFVPLWREHRVIQGMVEHNLAAIEYHNYHFFLGAYPNDESTIEAIRDLETRFSNVHLALCPHPGPTSKADCLNWLYQRMLLFEEEKCRHFEIVMTHDAEDLIHGESLRWVNHYSPSYDMIQIPVLALSTPIGKWTHGVYCDEFAEFQARDMRVRQAMGSFVPSNGVGTAFGREMLDRLAAAEGNRIFEPVCLTEDYENGLRLHLLGARQTFGVLQARTGEPVATREFFPQTFRAAVGQRTRWVIGISLQTWQRHGWRGSVSVKYWLWRDRKGLIGNPVSLLTDLIFLYGSLTWAISYLISQPWGLAQALSGQSWFLPVTLAMGLTRAAIRVCCVARLYGWLFAAGVPVRVFWANLINSLATVLAMHQFFSAMWRGEPLQWIKTEHAYPSLAALREHKRKLGEVLVGCAYLSQDELEAALASVPEGVRLGEHLIRLGYLDEEDLYDALSLQQGMPVKKLAKEEVRLNVARSLPARVMRSLRVLPFEVRAGSLFVAGPELPTEELQNELRRFTSLDIRFHLITPRNFEELAAELL